MNGLLIYPEEIKNSQITLTGDRAKHFLEAHNLSIGSVATVLIENKGISKATLTSLENDNTTLSFSCEPSTDSVKIEPGPQKENIHLIVAIARPQTVKKVIHYAATLGIKSLTFIKSEQAQKSYLTSKAVSEQEVRKELIKAMEQSVDPYPMQVDIQYKLLPYLEDKLPKIESFNQSRKIIAHPSGQPLSNNCNCEQQAQTKQNTPTFIAIGPEAGWSKFEITKFKESGFEEISLGQRILRTEVALTYLVSKIKQL